MTRQAAAEYKVSDGRVTINATEQQFEFKQHFECKVGALKKSKTSQLVTRHCVFVSVSV